MAITKGDVRAALEPDEPNYREAADRFGAEALPHLEELLDDPRPDIPAKAASLAGMIDAPEAAAVLEKAAASSDPIVRVAAAGATAELPPEAAERILLRLVRDGDLGVQKTALKAVSEPTERLRDAIRDLTLQDKFLSDLRDRALGRAPTGGTRGRGSDPQGETPRIGPMPGEERSGGPDSGAARMDAGRGTSSEGSGNGSMPGAESRTQDGEEMPTGEMPRTGGGSEMPGGAMD